MIHRLIIGLDASFVMAFDEEYTLRYLVKAEEAGFDFLWLGDHFLPWHDSFKHCFFVWSLIPAVAARTRRMKVGIDVTVPIGGRYHPAIIAQASATIDRIFPHRFALGVGTGEAMNEFPFMGNWPNWEERMARLIEAVDLIRNLWNSEGYFTYNGNFFKMENVFLYLKPKTQIPLYFSAFGEKSARIAGECSDRVMTVGPLERCRDIIFPKFEEGSRSVGRNPSQLEKAVSIDGGIGEPTEIIRKMRRLYAGGDIKEMFNEKDPRKIEKAASSLSDEQILHNSCICNQPQELIDVFDRFRRVGANQIIWGDFSLDPDKMMDDFRTKIIPYFHDDA
jgi:coenzyme F420-dependent glucose-6-phosphate dehydrogenase